MNLTFQLIDPAGEALLLVHTPVPREAYADLTRRLLAIRELAPRQAAFLTAPTQGGVVRVETAAAFCGGEVLRQAAFAFAVAREIRRERKVPVEGDGWPEALPAQVNPLTGQATLDFPLPQVQPGEGERGDRLLFPGVAWALQKGGRAALGGRPGPRPPGPGPGDGAPRSRPAGLGLPGPGPGNRPVDRPGRRPHPPPPVCRRGGGSRRLAGPAQPGRPPDLAPPPARGAFGGHHRHPGPAAQAAVRGGRGGPGAGVYRGVLNGQKKERAPFQVLSPFGISQKSPLVQPQAIFPWVQSPRYFSKN